MLDEYNTTAYLDLEQEDIAVTNIINKYKLSSQNNSFLFNVEDDYKILIEYICKLFIKDKIIPDEIKNELLHNVHFRSFIIKNTKNKIDNIFFDKKTIVFKEIVSIINLLSFGENFNIFENYNSYSLDNLSSLFKKYKEKLEENQLNKEEFELLFSHYLLLIEIMNVLCKINSNDLQRKKTINPIIEILTETINTLKFKVQLSPQKVNILNNILGKLLFYYSHIPYIDITNRNLNDVIDEFYFNFEKSTIGYQLSKSISFGNSNELKEYKIFLNTISTLLLNMIYKLESEYEYNEYKDLNLFKNILDLYENVIVHTNIPKFKTIFELKKYLINNYMFIYSGNCEYNIDIIINDFFNNKQFDNSTIQIIYAITLYSDIKNDTLIEILKKFLNMEKFHNDYLEFYKLNICDVIINKLIKHNFTLNENLCKTLVNYINENSVASHLISIYTKVFLSLSLYYSSFNDIKSIELSKNYYAIYININGYNLLNNEYLSINKKILTNYGESLIKDLDLEVTDITDEKLYNLGKKSVIKHISQKKLDKKFYINQKLSNLLTKILNEENLNNEKINNYIEEFISKDIFYGLVFCKVDGLCKKKCEILDLGYETINIPLFKQQFTLKIAYSTIYKDVCQNIYLNMKNYIEKNVSNIIITYQKTIPMFFDKITGLRNVTKLQKDLEELSNEFIFIEFYLHLIEDLNTKFGYVKTNEILKEYISQIEKLIDLYRLSGPKLGIVIPVDFNYEELITNIENITLSRYEEKINFKNTYAITWGNKDNILEKSSCCISLAKKDNKKSLELK